MPRGPVVATQPPGTTPQNPGDVIQSAVWNAAIDDIYNIFNTIQPKEYGGTGSSDLSLSATDFRVKDGTDGTKRVAFDASNITTATTRTITMGDADVTLRPQGWELIENAAINTAAASKAFSNLSAYRALRVTGFLIPVSDGVNLLLRSSIDNGLSFDSGASDYTYQHVEANGATLTGFQATTNAIQLNRTSVGNNTSEGISINLQIEQLNKNTYMQVSGSANVWNTSGSLLPVSINAARLSLTPRDSIQFRFAAGNIAGGFLTLEGVRS